MAISLPRINPAPLESGGDSLKGAADKINAAFQTIEQSVQFQFSADGTAWHEGYQTGDVYIRFSVDGGTSWTPGVRFVPPQAQVQFSANGTAWHPVYQSGDRYVRFSSDGGTSWTSAVPVGASPASVTFLSKSGHNSFFFVIDGKLYSAAGNNTIFIEQTTGIAPSGGLPRLGVYNMHNVSFPESGRLKKVGGGYYDCAFALFENGNLYTWGYNSNGTCGLGHTSVVVTPKLAAVGVLDAFDHPSLGGNKVDHYRLYILKQDGLYVTGYNMYGQLGVGDTAQKTVFTKCVGLPVSSPSDIAGVYPIGTTYGFTFVMTSDGRLWFAGYNATGVAGDGTTVSKSSFVDVTSRWVTPGKTLVDVKVYGGSQAPDYTDELTGNVVLMLLRYSDGTSEVKTCGSNHWGALGNGTTSHSSTPVLPIGLPRDGSVIDVAGFGGNPMTGQALCSDGRLYAWGYNAYGQVGDGTTTHVLTPKVVATGVTRLFSGGMAAHTFGYCAQGLIAKADGLYMCGYNEGFIAGMGSEVTGNVTSYSRVLLPGDDCDVVDVGHATSANKRRVLVALTSKGNLYAWGWNGEKLICDNSTLGFPIPQRVPLPRYA